MLAVAKRIATALRGRWLNWRQSRCLIVPVNFKRRIDGECVHVVVCTWPRRGSPQWLFNGKGVAARVRGWGCIWLVRIPAEGLDEGDGYLSCDRKGVGYQRRKALPRGFADGAPEARSEREHTEASRHALAWKFLESAHIAAAEHEFAGSCHGSLDLATSRWYLTSWRWCAAVVVRAGLNPSAGRLAAAARIDKLVDSIGGHYLKAQLATAGLDGAFVVRREPDPTVREGVVDWIAPNDAAYIAANALVPLYMRTGRSRYLESAVSVARWIQRAGLAEDGVPLVGYHLQKMAWERDYVFLDVAFTPALFVELYRATGVTGWLDDATAMAEAIVRRFYVGDGRFMKQIGTPASDAEFTRGYGWVLEGLNPILDHAPAEPELLEIGRAIVLRLINAQRSDGAWYYLMDKPWSGTAGKATPILAYQLARYARIIGDPRARSAAVSAWEWCARHQVRGADAGPGVGCIPSVSREGHIVRGCRGWRPVAMIYSTAYFVLATDELDMSPGRLG